MSVHRQSHNGQFVICRHDGQQWPCRTVSATQASFEALSERCQYICPLCSDFVWMQVQDGEMWCPTGDCSYYASQFELLDLLFDPALADVQVDMAQLSKLGHA